MGKNMKAIELFAGAGGLGMGLTLSGFKAAAVIEWDKWACDTIRQNKERGFPLVMDWPLVEADVRDWIRIYSSSGQPSPADLVAGGPPCQPFSMVGKHCKSNDKRNHFPDVVQAVGETRPKGIFTENVRAFPRLAFAKSFENRSNWRFLRWPFSRLSGTGLTRNNGSRLT